MKSDWRARAARVWASSRNHLTATLASMTARSIARIPHPSNECRAVPTRRGLPSKSIHAPCGLNPIPSGLPIEDLSNRSPEDLAPVDPFQPVHLAFHLVVHTQRDKRHAFYTVYTVYKVRRRRRSKSERGATMGSRRSASGLWCGPGHRVLLDEEVHVVHRAVLVHVLRVVLNGDPFVGLWRPVLV